MAYTIQRQSTTGLWIIVDTSTGKTISRAELPSDAVNLAVTKGIPRSDLAGLVESAQAQERAENQVASSQTAGDSQGVNRGSDGTGTNAGNSQTAEPVTAEEKNNVETAKVSTTDSLTTGETEVKAEPAPETADPQSANNTVIDGQSSQTQSKNATSTNITPNQLHQYPTYTYGLTLHLLTPDTYNAMSRGEDWLPAAKTLISTAGRWGKDEDNKSRFTRPTQFADDFYFDGLTLNTVIGLNSQGRASNVIDISFNLIEPYGLTLLNRLMDLAEELGIPNYLANPYVLQIDFFGNDDVGLPVHPIPNITKYLPIKIIEMKMKVGVGGATYACRATPYNHIAFGQTIASTPANFEVKASTVRDFFQNDADESNLSSSLQKNQQRATEVQNLQNSQNAPARNQSQSRQGAQYQQQQATTQAIIDAKKQAIAKPYEVDSYNSAYNTYQKFLVNSESIQHPTTIKFIIDEEIANSAIVYEKKNSMSATTMNNNKDSKAINKSYAGARGGSNTSGPQLNVERFNINAGTNVMEVINLVMRNSTYITDQLKDNKQTDKDGNPLMMFKVIPQIQLKDFDHKKNDFSYDITFSIKKYSYHNSKHPLMSISSQEQIKRNLRKRYDYIYTGKNSDIIDFSIDFDALFYTAVNVGTKNLGKITESQDTASESTSNTTGSAGAGRGSTASYADMLPKQRANVVNPNQVYPVSGDLSAAGANSGQNSSIQKAADVMNSVYSNARGDMLNLKMKIIGDPDFIKQDDVFLNPANTNYPAETETHSESGSILTDRGDIFARVLFKTPVDIDPDTGGLRQEEKYLESNFSGIYKILKVTSEFRGGKFEQTMDAVRFHDDIVDPATSTGVTQRTDTTPSTISGQDELNTAPIQATNASTLRARQDQLSGESTESYSNVQENKIENIDNTQTSRLEEVALNGETRNVTEVQATGSTSKDSTADNTAAAPPAAPPPPPPAPAQSKEEIAYNDAMNATTAAEAKWLDARRNWTNLKNRADQNFGTDTEKIWVARRDEAKITLDASYAEFKSAEAKSSAAYDAFQAVQPKK